MKFYYEWDEPELAEACHELEVRQIIEQGWRDARRRSSLTLLLLVPLLAALLAASFAYLSRSQVSGWTVLAVTMLGGLLGGVLVSLRRLVPLVRTRLAPPFFAEGLPWPLLVSPLLAGAGAGALSAVLLASMRGGETYRPQTLYLIALLASIVSSRLLPVRMVSASIGGVR